MGIGTDTMNAINKAAQELNGCVQEKFEPYEGVYRINDGDYVSEKNWKKVWNQYPSWWSDAWMLAGNGTYSETDVTDMSIEEINEAWKTPILKSCSTPKPTKTATASHTSTTTTETSMKP